MASSCDACHAMHVPALSPTRARSVCTMERVLKEFQHVGSSVAFIVSATKMRCDASAKTKYYTVAWRRYGDAADDDAPIPRTVRINICALQNMN